jgi:hypothetical protein
VSYRGAKKSGEFDAFFASRATYLSEAYDPTIKERYPLELSVPLTNLIKGVTPTEVVLWFEEDLFCKPISGLSVIS